MFVIDNDVSFRDLNDHAIIVNIRTGFYYTLNGSATTVFHGIREGRDLAEVACQASHPSAGILRGEEARSRCYNFGCEVRLAVVAAWSGGQ